jgi:two-component SAPR family response regulator
MRSDFQIKEKSQINVAIVCFDLSVAKKLSQVFKQVGVHPYVCTSLSEFWEDSMKNKPDLTIIDVKMMSQGEILFKDHPLVVNQELSVAFYYEQDSAALLYSTFDILNLGFLSYWAGQKRS